MDPTTIGPIFGVSGDVCIVNTLPASCELAKDNRDLSLVSVFASHGVVATRTGTEPFPVTTPVLRRLVSSFPFTCKESTRVHLLKNGHYKI